MEETEAKDTQMQSSAETKLLKVKNRKGDIREFNAERITNAIFKAAQSIGGSNIDEAVRLKDKVLLRINSIADKQDTELIDVELIQDNVEKVLIEEGHAKTAKAYILYREKHKELREMKSIQTLDLQGLELGDEVSNSLVEMFKHKTKLNSVVGKELVNDYQTLIFKLRKMQRAGTLPLHPNNEYLGGNDLASNIYKKKYFLKDINSNLIEQRPEDVFARVSSFIAAIEPTEKKQLAWSQAFYNSMYDGYFVPGGRIIAGSGDLYRLKTLANCFVTLIDKDNIESIYKSAYDCARTYSYGGGIGVDISVLRPKDSVVHNAADKSTGAVSFMELYSLTTGLIGQSGRRGALMLTIDVKHPDVMDFIQVKKFPNWVTSQIVEQCKWSDMFSEKQLNEIERQVRENTQVRFANISLKVTDEFMRAVEESEKYPNKILLYRKPKSVDNSSKMQDYDTIHYSYGIPSKPIEKYSFIEHFNTLEELNEFLHERSISSDVIPDDLRDPLKRDIFGDFIIDGTEFDYAVKNSGDYLLYFNSEQTGELKKIVKARDIWNKFIEGNYSTAEPGLIFWSNMVKYSPSNYVDRKISSTNPCGEVPLESGGACNLGSINLSRFVKDSYTPTASLDLDKLKETVHLGIRFLDNVISWNERLNPLEEQRSAAKLTRRLGLGIVGIADMLNQLGHGYDSDEGIQIIEKVMKFIADKSYEASAILAEEKGNSPIYDFEDYQKSPFYNEAISKETQELIKEKGLRNIAILSIAPTGTISNIVLGYKKGDKHYIGVSGGVEPIFALFYTRRSESFGNVFFKIFHSTVQAYIDQMGLTDKAKDCSEEELKEILPKHFFRTAHNINPNKRVIIQGICQKFIDQSISSTVNLSEDISPETISNIYLNAWKKNVKGITIYREGSRFPILKSETEKTDFQDFKERSFKLKGKDGSVIEGKGDTVITLPNGKLTTIYHLIKMQKGGN